jgi:uncharacterized protein (DUF58 family)
LASALAEAAPRLVKRGLLLLVSDCLDDIAQLISALTQLRSQQHEILIFQIFDRDELEFSFKGWTRFESLETSGISSDVDPAALKAIYLENLARFQADLAAGCKKNSIHLFTCITDEPVEEGVAGHLRAGANRRET